MCLRCVGAVVNERGCCWPSATAKLQIRRFESELCSELIECIQGQAVVVCVQSLSVLLTGKYAGSRRQFGCICKPERAEIHVKLKPLPVTLNSFVFLDGYNPDVEDGDGSFLIMC